MTYYLECTPTCHSDANTGIQRVVRNLVLLSVEAGERPVVPVRFDNGRFYPVKLDRLRAKSERDTDISWARRAGLAIYNYFVQVFRAGRHFLAVLLPIPFFVRFMIAPKDRFGLSWLLTRCLVPFGAADPRVAAVTAEQGDVLVMLDASWYADHRSAIEDFKRKGGSMAWVAYDMIPCTHPQFWPRQFVQVFGDWVDAMLGHADAVLCISRTTGEAVKASLPFLRATRPSPPKISYFWLGSEVTDKESEAKEVRADLRRPGAGGKPVYLYVSTVEPRKNQAYTLDAFDLLWQQGVAASIVFVGRIGWHCEDFLERVRRHPALGESLFLFHDVSDTELDWLYSQANGLVFTSFIEGFGLPIVEALQKGLPAFASDIPVFREIGGKGVTFVDLAHPNSLTEAIAEHVARDAPRLAAPIGWLSWRESTEQFWQRLENCLAPDPDRSALVE